MAAFALGLLRRQGVGAGADDCVAGCGPACARPRRRSAWADWRHRVGRRGRPDGVGLRESGRHRLAVSRTTSNGRRRRKPMRCASVCSHWCGRRATSRSPSAVVDQSGRSRAGGRSHSRCSGSATRAPFRRCNSWRRRQGATPDRLRPAASARIATPRRVPVLRTMIEQARADVGVTVSAVRALAQIGAPGGRGGGGSHSGRRKGRSQHAPRSGRRAGHTEERRGAALHPRPGYRRVADDARGGDPRGRDDRSRGLSDRAVGHGAGSALDGALRHRRRAGRDARRDSRTTAAADARGPKTSACCRR